MTTPVVVARQVRWPHILVLAGALAGALVFLLWAIASLFRRHLPFVEICGLLFFDRMAREAFGQLLAPGSLTADDRGFSQETRWRTDHWHWAEIKNLRVLHLPTANVPAFDDVRPPPQPWNFPPRPSFMKLAKYWDRPALDIVADLERHQARWLATAGAGDDEPLRDRLETLRLACLGPDRGAQKR